MKKLIALSFLLFIINFGYSQKVLRTDTYDTTYSNGYIVSVDTGSNYAHIKPIIKQSIYITKQVPCSTVFVWSGGSKDSTGMYFSESGIKYDSTKDYGPCGFSGGFSMGYWSAYKGDTVIDNNCESSTYGVYKENYFIPKKNKKGKQVRGKQYELKPLDYYGGIDDWTEKSFLIMCI